MDARTISAMYLGNTTATAMYLGNSKVWPVATTPTSSVLRNYINGYNNAWQIPANELVLINGATVTSILEITGSGGVAGYQNTSSWVASGPYWYIGSAFRNHYGTEYYDEQVIKTNGSTWYHSDPTPPVTRKWTFPNLVEIGNFEFAFAGAGVKPIEINIPKCTTVGPFAFNDIIGPGTLTIHSTVTASAAWSTCLPKLLAANMSITYNNR